MLSLNTQIGLGTKCQRLLEETIVKEGAVPFGHVSVSYMMFILLGFSG